MVPRLALHELRDDPTNNTRGWNFLHDPRTCKALPAPGDRWLLDRVLGLVWLREEFLEIRSLGPTRVDKVLWREGPVDQYLHQLDSFLQQLLLLVHVTGG